jgi:hypothetical protein
MILKFGKGRSGRDRMVVGVSTTCAISAYHHLSCEFEPCSWRGVLDTTLCDKVCQWFSPCTPESRTFYCNAIQDWNLLPDSIKFITDLQIVKKEF